MKYEIKINKLPKSEVEIEVSIPKEVLENARTKAIKSLGENLEIDGFRKGHIPEKVIAEKAGEALILDESADIVLKEHFPKIIEQENFDIIGQPKISITKIALGNPFEFKAVFAVLPEITLPDYKKISKEVKEKNEKKEEKIEVTEKEVDDVLLQIRKNKAHIDWSHSASASRDEHGNLVHDHPDFSKEENLPPLDDELAKSAGNFKDLSELKEKVNENIKAEKEHRAKDKLRAEMIEAILKEIKVELPEVLVESETNKSLAQMKDDVARMGGKWEDYLAHTKKKEEDLKKELRENSEKKALTQLVFNKIAEVEKIEPNKDILENEMKEIMKMYPEAKEESARIYVSTILINQEVLKILEG
jgi:trigger factor